PLVEARRVECAALDGRDLLVGRAGGTRYRDVLRPLVRRRRTPSDEQDRQLAQAWRELLAGEDGGAGLEQPPGARLSPRQPAEDVELDREPLERLADLLGGAGGIDVGQTGHARS